MELNLGGKFLLTVEDLLNKVTEYQIYRYYLGYDFTPGQLIDNPFREDSKPSFGIYLNPKGLLIYNDYSKVNGGGGDCIQFVQKMYSLNYTDALLKVYQDFKLKDYDPNDITSPVNTLPRGDNYTNEEAIRIALAGAEIAIRTQPFTYTDFMYWKSFGIEIDTLVKYNVNACRAIYINHILASVYNHNNPIYSYNFDGKYKIYKPLEPNKKYKWLTNVKEEHYQGYDQLPWLGELLIITKSLKDVMVLYTLGYNAVAPHSESVKISTEWLARFESRFDNIVLFFDNDEAGIIGASKIYKEHNLSNIIIPQCEGIKDIAEYRRINGRLDTEDLLKRLI